MTTPWVEKAAAIDLIFRFSPGDPKPLFAPADWEETRVYLQAGNEVLGRYYDACKRGYFEDGETPPRIELSAFEALGEPKGDDGLQVQYPFAVVFGCSDARVPPELVFGQDMNDLFNIRVAGNVLTRSGEGSLLYALRNFVKDDPSRPRSLKMVVSLGHRGCGAVRATVAAFLDSEPSNLQFPDDPVGDLLRRIADPPLAVAVKALEGVLGPGSSRFRANAATLAELTVYVNAAWTGHLLRRVVDGQGPDVSGRVGVVYGVFDPADLRVHSRPHHIDDPEGASMAEPPADLAALEALAQQLARNLRPRPPTLS